MPSTHISIRVTDQRRANLDALAAIIRSDSDAATIDWALGYALARLQQPEPSRPYNFLRDYLLKDPSQPAE